MSPAAQIPEGSVVITPIEMYREQQATHTTVLGVVSKLDSLAEKLDANRITQAQRMDEMDASIEDHEKRIRQAATVVEVEKVASRVSQVERRIWMAVGALGALSGGAGVLSYIKH